MNHLRIAITMGLFLGCLTFGWSQLTVVNKSAQLLRPNTQRSFSLAMPAISWLSLPSSSPAPSFLDLRNASQLKNVQLPAYQVKDLAFFCRLEVRLESATRIPVRFRLGDVQYVDHLEGKIDGVLLGY